MLFMFESFVLYKWGVQIIIQSCSIATNDIYRIHLHTCMYVGTFAHLFHFIHQAPIEFTQCSYSFILYICIVEFSIIIIIIIITTIYRHLLYHNKYHYHHLLITTIIFLDIIILTIFLFYFISMSHLFIIIIVWMDGLLSTWPVGLVNWRLYVL